MKVVTRQYYKCEKCGEEYGSDKEALSCESNVVSKDKGVKIGDTIIITGGQGIGKKAVVSRIFVYSKLWGHYDWKRYWHTVGLNADIIGEAGSRQLVFNDYEVIKEEEDG